MRRSARLAEKQGNSKNEAQKEPKAKKNRTDNRHSNSATFDNGTLIEAFKYLNYCQLANGSLVSKRFRNLIRTHRHSLPLLYVYQIVMEHMNICVLSSNPVKLFKTKLSPRAYNKWVVCNRYSKQIPLDCQVTGIKSTQDEGNRYVFRANADYKDAKGPQQNTTNAFFAPVKLSNDNWPLFQHFVSLFTDPFIYVRQADFFLQNDDEIMFLNLLASAINSDRLRCKNFKFGVKGNGKFIAWVKEHVLCDEFQISLGYSDPNYDAELLDLLVTGAQCTSKINVKHYDLSKVVIDFVQKFIDLKECDQNQRIESILGEIAEKTLAELKRKCIKFVVKKEEHEGFDYNVQDFEFVNNDFGKKLQFSAKIFAFADEDETDYDFVLTVNNL